jgi:hypothetical protein
VRSGDAKGGSGCRVSVCVGAAGGSCEVATVLGAAEGEKGRGGVGSCERWSVVRREDDEEAEDGVWGEVGSGGIGGSEEDREEGRMDGSGRQQCETRKSGQGTCVGCVCVAGMSTTLVALVVCWVAPDTGNGCRE